MTSSISDTSAKASLFVQAASIPSKIVSALVQLLFDLCHWFLSLFRSPQEENIQEENMSDSCSESSSHIYCELLSDPPSSRNSRLIPSAPSFSEVEERVKIPSVSHAETHTTTQPTAVHPPLCPTQEAHSQGLGVNIPCSPSLGGGWTYPTPFSSDMQGATPAHKQKKKRLYPDLSSLLPSKRKRSSSTPPQEAKITPQITHANVDVGKRLKNIRELKRLIQNNGANSLKDLVEALVRVYPHYERILEKDMNHLKPDIMPDEGSTKYSFFESHRSKKDTFPNTVLLVADYSKRVMKLFIANLNEEENEEKHKKLKRKDAGLLDKSLSKFIRSNYTSKGWSLEIRRFWFSTQSDAHRKDLWCIAKMLQNEGHLGPVIMNKVVEEQPRDALLEKLKQEEALLTLGRGSD